MENKETKKKPGRKPKVKTEQVEKIPKKRGRKPKGGKIVSETNRRFPAADIRVSGSFQGSVSDTFVVPVIRRDCSYNSRPNQYATFIHVILSI